MVGIFGSVFVQAERSLGASFRARLGLLGQGRSRIGILLLLQCSVL